MGKFRVDCQRIIAILEEWDYIAEQEEIRATSSPQSSTRARSDLVADPLELLRQMAEVGIRSITIRPVISGVEACIDDRVAVRFSPMQGHLLSILTEAPGEDEDGLLPWQSRAAVLEALSQRVKREVSTQALDQLVLKLRERLIEARVNPFYLQVSRDKGLRFALRRSKPADEEC